MKVTLILIGLTMMTYAFQEQSLRRLTSHQSGRLQIFTEGRWTTACNQENFTDNDAKVMCANMGLEGGLTMNVSVSGDNAKQLGKTGLQNFMCTGDEKNFWDCPGRMKGWRSRFVKNGTLGVPMKGGNAYNLWRLEFPNNEPEAAFDLCQNIPGCVGVSNKSTVTEVVFNSYGPSTGSTDVSDRFNQDAAGDFVDYMDGLTNQDMRCTKMNADFGLQSNQTVCPGGSNKNNGFIFEVTFTEKETKTWFFRFGIDFTGGALVKFDDEIVSDSQLSMQWNNNWDNEFSSALNFNKSVNLGVHTMKVYAVQNGADRPSRIQFQRTYGTSNANAWKNVNVNELDVAIGGAISDNNFSFAIDSGYSIPKMTPLNLKDVSGGQLTGTATGLPDSTANAQGDLDTSMWQSWVLSEAGLMNNQAASDFSHWLDETTVDATNWRAPYEPNDSGLQEDFVHISNYDGTWNDQGNNRRYGCTLCEDSINYVILGDKQLWPEANKACASVGMRLPITWAAKFEEVYTLLKANSNCVDGGFHMAPIGLKRYNFSRYASNKCGHTDDVGISCEPRTMMTKPGTGFMRLVDETEVVKFAQIQWDLLKATDFTVTDVDVKDTDGVKRINTQNEQVTITDNGRFIQWKVSDNIAALEPENSFLVSQDIESFRAGADPEQIPSDFWRQIPASQRYEMFLPDTTLFNKCDDNGKIEDISYYTCIFSLYFHAVQNKESTARGNMYVANASDTTELSLVWAQKVTQDPKMSASFDEFDLFQRNAISVTVEGLDVSATKYIDCFTTEAKTGNALPKKAGDFMQTVCEQDTQNVEIPELEAWIQGNKIQLTNNMEPNQNGQIIGFRDDFRNDTSLAEGIIKLRVKQQHKGLDCWHEVKLIAQLKGFGPGRRMTEENQGVWSANSQLAGNILDESGEDVTYKGEGTETKTIATKEGEGEDGSGFIQSAILIIMAFITFI